MTRKQKEKILYDFKSTLLENSYSQIKRKMLYKLNNVNCRIVYSSKTLESKLFEKDKQEIYIELLSKVVNAVNDELTIIIFDSFGNHKFENRIINTIKKYNNVISVESDYSFNNKGLQFADNVCGVIRRHLLETDNNDFYKIIEKKVIKV